MQGSEGSDHGLWVWMVLGGLALGFHVAGSVHIDLLIDRMAH